jgi:hypothetical protein
VTPELVELVAHVTEGLGADAAVLRQQAEAATVMSSSPTMVDLAVPTSLPRCSLDDGPTPGAAVVYAGGELVGEILVWIRSGYLTSLEQAWYTDEPPTAWPSPADVRVDES